MSTITCPKCGQSLPAWAQRCQFCGTEMHPGFVRPVDAYKYATNNRMSWKEAAYVVVSVLIVLQGSSGILLALLRPNIFSAYLGTMCAIQAGLGLGMLFHQLWAQFVMKWICILSILGGGFALMRDLMLINTRFGSWISVGMTSFNLILVSFTLYILYSEADV